MGQRERRWRECSKVAEVVEKVVGVDGVKVKPSRGRLDGVRQAAAMLTEAAEGASQRLHRAKADGGASGDNCTVGCVKAASVLTALGLETKIYPGNSGTALRARRNLESCDLPRKE